MITLSSTVVLLSSPFIGSFLANTAVRLPEGRTIATGRSVCPSCSVRIAAYDLIPVVSWVILNRKCRTCGFTISAFYPGVELATVTVAIWCDLVSPGWSSLISFLFGCPLLLLALIDWLHYWLPDILTLPLIPAGLLVTWIIQPASISAHIIGAAAGYLMFFLVKTSYRHFRSNEGLGQGDLKLLAALGAWVSWTGLPTVVILAAMGGLICVIAKYLLTKQPIRSNDRVPFGSFLAIAGWIVWLYYPLLPAAIN